MISFNSKIKHTIKVFFRLCEWGDSEAEGVLQWLLLDNFTPHTNPVNKHKSKQRRIQIHSTASPNPPLKYAILHANSTSNLIYTHNTWNKIFTPPSRISSICQLGIQVSPQNMFFLFVPAPPWGIWTNIRYHKKELFLLHSFLSTFLEKGKNQQSYCVCLCRFMCLSLMWI